MNATKRPSAVIAARSLLGVVNPDVPLSPWRPALLTLVSSKMPDDDWARPAATVPTTISAIPQTVMVALLIAKPPWSWVFRASRM
jgi:hypothetical protein